MESRIDETSFGSLNHYMDVLNSHLGKRVTQIRFKLLPDPDDRQRSPPHDPSQLIGGSDQPFAVRAIPPPQKVVHHVDHNQDWFTHTCTLTRHVTVVCFEKSIERACVEQMGI